MKAVYARQAIKALERMDTAARRRIGQGIESIPKGDMKRLRGHSELYRLRVGDWRVVFTFPDDETVLVERISPRGDVYKGV